MSTLFCNISFYSLNDQKHYSKHNCDIFYYQLLFTELLRLQDKKNLGALNHLQDNFPTKPPTLDWAQFVQFQLTVCKQQSREGQIYCDITKPDLVLQKTQLILNRNSTQNQSQTPTADTLPQSAVQGSNWRGLSHSQRKAVPRIDKPRGAQDRGIRWSKTILT